MAITRDPFLNMALFSQGHDPWATEGKENAIALGKAIGGWDNIAWVSPAFSEANLFPHGLPTTRRHFDTIQGAVNEMQGSVYGHRKMIILGPGPYPENVTVSGSIGIAGFYPPHAEALGAGLTASINGQTGVQSPLITVEPANEETIALSLVNLFMENKYNQTYSTINKANLIDFKAPPGGDASAPAVSCRLGMKNIQAKLHTWGDNNNWLYGIKTRGHVRTMMSGVELTALGYAGGNHNGGILYICDIEGTSNTSKRGGLYIKHSSFDSQYLQAAGGAALFRLNRDAIGIIARSDMYCYDPTKPDNQGTIFLDGGTGTNYLTGTVGNAITDRYNIMQIDLNYF